MKKHLLVSILFFFILLNFLIPFSFSQKEYSVEELKNIIKKSPDDHQLHNQLGLLYVRTKQYKDAISEFEVAFNLKPNSAEYANNLGTAYYLSGKLDEAIVFFKKAVQLDSSLTSGFLNLGTVYYKKGDTENAIKNFVKAIELSPEEFVAYENLGEIYSNLMDWENAIKYYEKALKIIPDQPVIMNNLSYAYLKAGDKKKALQLLEKVNILLPGNETVVKNLNIIKNYLGEAPLKKEEGATKQEMFFEKQSQLSEINKKIMEENPVLEQQLEIAKNIESPKEEKIKKTTGNKLKETKSKKEYQSFSPEEMQKGIKKVEKQKEKKSSLEKELEKKIREGKYVLMPASKIRLEDIISKEEKERKKKREEEKRKKLNEERIKNKAENYYKNSIKYLSSNNIPKAYSFISKAIELNPNIANYHITAGVIELLSNNFEYAKAHFDKALEIEPQNQKALYCIAYLYYKSNDFANAKEKLLPLITQTSISPNPYGLYGSIKLIESKPEESKEHLQKAIDKGITDAAIFNNLSLIYLTEGNDEKAIQLLKEALKYNYNDEVIQNNFHFITAKYNKENSLKDEISKIFKSEKKISYLHDIDIVMNQLKIAPLNFYNYIKDRWNKKKIVILPFTQSDGYEKWETTPGEKIANSLRQNIPKNKYFEVEFINDNHLSEIFSKNKNNFITEFIQYHDADIIIGGKYIGFSSRMDTEKKMYGTKKINNTIIELNTELEIFDMQKEEIIYSDVFTSEAKLRKSRPIDLSVKTKINLEHEATKKMGENIYNLLINYFNLKAPAKPFYIPPKIEEKSILESKKKYYKLKQF